MCVPCGLFAYVNGCAQVCVCSVEVREGTKVSWGGMFICVSVCAYGMWDVWECKMRDMSVYVCDMCGICDVMCDPWCLCDYVLCDVCDMCVMYKMYDVFVIYAYELCDCVCCV